MDSIPHAKVSMTSDGLYRFDASWHWLGVTVPKGFLSDGTSSPWLMRKIVPRGGRLVWASFIHDRCLEYMPRKEAAAKFREALGILRASKVQCSIRYTGVRFYDIFVAPFKKN